MLKTALLVGLGCGAAWAWLSTAPVAYAIRYAVWENSPAVQTATFRANDADLQYLEAGIAGRPGALQRGAYGL